MGGSWEVSERKCHLRFDEYDGIREAELSLLLQGREMCLNGNCRSCAWPSMGCGRCVRNRSSLRAILRQYDYLAAKWGISER